LDRSHRQRASHQSDPALSWRMLAGGGPVNSAVRRFSSMLTRARKLTVFLCFFSCCYASAGAQSLRRFSPRREVIIKLPQTPRRSSPEAFASPMNRNAEQIVGPERRERVLHQTWCGEGRMNSRRPVNSNVGPRTYE
jgi:hypothetical protein